MTETPATSTELLQAAAENIRMAMHVDGPHTPPECYDQIGALHDITAKLEQHLERVGRALNDASNNPALRSSPVSGPAEQTVEQTALSARGAAFRVQMVAGDKLRGLVRELNTAWSATSALAFADPDGAALPRASVDAVDAADAEDAADVPIEEAVRRAAQDMADADRRNGTTAD